MIRFCEGMFALFPYPINLHFIPLLLSLRFYIFFLQCIGPLLYNPIIFLVHLFIDSHMQRAR